jgi:hypothetical protein
MYRQVVAIFGMPRSGTSWLGQILDSAPNVAYRLEPIFSYAFKNAVDERSSRADYTRFFEGIYESKDDFLLQRDRRGSGFYPIFEKDPAPDFLVFKTTRFHHLLSGMLSLLDDLKVISIVRNPCGAMSSWLHTPGEFPASADPKKEWRYGHCRKTAIEEFWGFEDWKHVTRLHLTLARQYPERMTIVQYEHLVDNPFDIVPGIFKFLGLTFSVQTRSFLADCHKRNDENSYSVYKDKSVARQWKRELDPEIRDEIVSGIVGTELARFLVE